MNDKQLKSFITVTECGSFTKAENFSFFSAQALKKQIDSLENELGFALFLRSSKGVVLTAAGKNFYEEIKKILEQLEQVKITSREIALHEQVIRIENPLHPRLLLEDALSEFSQQYPEIKQDIIFRKNRKDISSRILNGTIDISECTLRPDLIKPGIAYTKIKSLNYMVLVYQNHPLANKSEIKFEDLSNMQVYLSHTSYLDLFRDFEQYSCNTVLKDTDTDDIANIFNICFNNAVYITKAFFATNLPPLVALPLVSDLVKEAVVIYRDPPSPIVQKFLKIIQQLYGPNTD